jgi:starch synthase
MPGTRFFVYLVDCPECYQRPSLYTSDPDEHLRFLVLTHAAFLGCQRMGFSPQVMHFNDWHTAMGPLLLRTLYSWDRLFQHTRSVLTIHNIGYQGVVSASHAAEVLPSGSTAMLDQTDLSAGRINILRQGVLYADLITTVSPTYALEIRSPDYGMGLEGTLRARSDELVGILNGVDYDEWDPRRDRYLPRHYGTNQLGIKAALKDEFLRKHNLQNPPRTPLIGIVSRLAAQKGFDLLFDVLPELLREREFNLFVLGSGEARFQDFFASLPPLFPSRVAFHLGYSDQLAHWIEACSDMFLMPSRYEPCGLNQLYSLRYGSVPIVRRTGGLADSVQHFDPQSGIGTGIVFNDYNPQGVRWALNTALDCYRNPGLWRQLVQNGMAQDYSWSRQVRRYEELYQRLLQRDGVTP